MKSQMGKFYIDNYQIKNNPLDIMQIMGRCVVLRAERLWEKDRTEYIALSSQFQVIPEGCMAPEYVWEKRNNEWWAKRI
jgi:hypothetical protein